MSDTEDLGSFLSGLIIGGLIGAAVALLLAPQSGEETRVLIRDKSIELKDRAVETAEEARVRAEAAAAEARARADELAHEARIKAEELKQRGQHFVEEQKDKASDILESGKEPTKRKRSAGEDLPPEVTT
jgi:gas vesicle protein